MHIAAELGVSRPTVCVALKKLEGEGFLLLDGTKAVKLTEQGRAVAVKTLERHSTLQAILVNLGVDEEIARHDACEMEHAVSQESFEALKTLVGKHIRNEMGESL